MVIGVGYRLLPMVLPSGTLRWATALLLEIGVAGLLAILVTRGRWTPAFAAVIVCGSGSSAPNSNGQRPPGEKQYNRPAPPVATRFC
jgi:hypothetical protein